MNPDRVIAVRTQKTVYKDGDSCVKVFGADYSAADVLSEALALRGRRKREYAFPKCAPWKRRGKRE